MGSFLGNDGVDLGVVGEENFVLFFGYECVGFGDGIVDNWEGFRVEVFFD